MDGSQVSSTTAVVLLYMESLLARFLPETSPQGASNLAVSLNL